MSSLTSREVEKMRSLLVSLLCAVSLTNLDCVKGTSQKRTVNSDATQERPKEDAVDRETAIRVATEKAAGAYGSLVSYSILPCEDRLVWRIFFEARNPSLGKTAVMYVVEKSSGRITSERELPLIAKHDQKGEKRILGPTSINKDGALAIARRDAGRAYGSLQQYEVAVCELSRAWYVVYSPRMGLDGGGPEYVIDKETGQIIDKVYYQ
jgi:hypothetical protein